jgi:hypothetical protein
MVEARAIDESVLTKAQIVKQIDDAIDIFERSL